MPNSMVSIYLVVNLKFHIVKWQCKLNFRFQKKCTLVCCHFLNEKIEIKQIYIYLIRAGFLDYISYISYI